MNYRTHDMEEIGKTLGKSIINLNKIIWKKINIIYVWNYNFNIFYFL